jgi:hypothetical protein
MTIELQETLNFVLKSGLWLIVAVPAIVGFIKIRLNK